MTAPRFGGIRAALTAGLAGFSCMAAELTAVRLQAPWFGDSAYVWTNVIGVILAALSGGAALGGILAARPDARRQVVGLAIVSGLLLAVIPLLAAPLGRWLLPQDLPLDVAMAAIVRGSLVATALLFAPSMLLLGAIGPLLVTTLTREGVAVGKAAATVSSAGT
ncbi:MAG: fused MFS/spermidine synthase, partial [Planctomycetes bacterium]|nr:fused MFS/spermidine synthase [Planctomycetota bacterium]